MNKYENYGLLLAEQTQRVLCMIPFICAVRVGVLSCLRLCVWILSGFHFFFYS